jgi:hypothetical protein
VCGRVGRRAGGWMVVRVDGSDSVPRSDVNEAKTHEAEAEAKTHEAEAKTHEAEAEARGRKYAHFNSIYGNINV